jgi:hypothetical protein
MFNFSNKNTNPETQALQTEINETQTRFFAFVEKLELRMKEFAEASIPELTALNTTDTDNFKQGYHRMRSAVMGQLNSIRQKVNDVLEEKVDYFQNIAYHQNSEAFFDFRSQCNQRLEQFEALYNRYREDIEATDQEDFEIAYQKILDEFEAIKNKFKCVQCGSPVLIDKMYFTTTYLACSTCQTQNTYEPSTQAKGLEHLGRSLAEQRTAHLLKSYDETSVLDQELYLQKHQLEVSLFNEKDQKVITEKTIEIEKLAKQRQDLENSRPLKYQTYLRAMFDEWNKINPAMQLEHEKFYTRLLNENQKSH